MNNGRMDINKSAFGASRIQIRIILDIIFKNCLHHFVGTLFIQRNKLTYLFQLKREHNL